MKIGCTCGFIGVCGVFAIIAQIVGIIIPKVLVLEIELHRDDNFTLNKFVEKVHMEVEEESSDEDDILEIESLTKNDMEYMYNIEKLILIEIQKEFDGVTNNRTKQKHTTKRNLDRKIENVTNIKNDLDYESDKSKDNSTVRAGKSVCKDSSEETSSSSNEEDETKAENEEEEEEDEKDDKNQEEQGDGEEEEKEEAGKVDDEDKGEMEKEKGEEELGTEKEREEDEDDDDSDDDDDDDSDDDSSSSCSESSESEDEKTESHSFYSSISIGLWDSYICTNDGINQTEECASMSFPDALHILKKDARGFVEADFDLSMWHKVKLECVFSLISCVLGLAFLIASVTKHFERRQLVALVLGSFGFVSSGVFTLVPVTRVMIVSVDAFKSSTEDTHTFKLGLPSSLIAFSVCGVFSMITAFGLISVTWYDRKHKWRVLVRMTKQFDTDLNERLNDANIAKVYSDPERVESVYYDVRSSSSDLTVHKSNEDHGKFEEEENDKRNSVLGARCVETIEIELTDMSERETAL